MTYFRFEKSRHLKLHVPLPRPRLQARPHQGVQRRRLVSSGAGQASSGSDCFDYHSCQQDAASSATYRVVHERGVLELQRVQVSGDREGDQVREGRQRAATAHNKEEIAYHPSRYKTQPCSYPAQR